ncbi:MAG: Putative transcriptional regulator [uncultured Sulfurovum sp.]|uniref:Transcriptional regulator n=1 Tax=uncultured Sulfurovum sp. TaxID=269237 RepID=A0A6S6T329_9BACT|nr:MAG: Putative transcriptional regulator [uncultured Sulfurovum sp.]
MKLFDIGKRVKELRKEQNITQEELAKKAGISRVTLGKLERGQMGAVSIRTLDVILHSLNHELSISESLDGFGIPTLDEMNERD